MLEDVPGEWRAENSTAAGWCRATSPVFSVGASAPAFSKTEDGLDQRKNIPSTGVEAGFNGGASCSWTNVLSMLTA